MTTAFPTKLYLATKLDTLLEGYAKTTVLYGAAPNKKTSITVDVLHTDWDETSLYASTGGRPKVKEAYSIYCGIIVEYSANKSPAQAEAQAYEIYEVINEAIYADITLGGNVQRAMCTPVNSYGRAGDRGTGAIATMVFQVSCKTNNS